MKNTLERALPIVARVISEKYEGGLDVIVGGNQAATDGRTIFLPTLPETGEARLLARGYIDHEAAHIRYTDFNVENDVLTNAIEDIRIEDLVSREFRGAKVNLQALSRWYTDNHPWTNPAQNSNHNVLAQYVHFKLRRDVLHNEVGNQVDSAEEELLNRFGKAFKAAVDKIIRPALKSTEDAKRRAKALRALLKENQSSQPNQQGQPNQQDQNGQQGQDGQQGQQGQSGGLPEEDSDEAENGQGGGKQNDSGSDPNDSSQDDSQQAGQGETDSYESQNKQKGSGQFGENDPDQDGSSQGSGQESGQDNSGDESGQGTSGQDGSNGSSADSADSDDSDANGNNSDTPDSSGSGGSGASKAPDSASGDNDNQDALGEETFQGVGEIVRQKLNVLKHQAEREDDLGVFISSPAQKPNDSLVLPDFMKTRLLAAKKHSTQLRRRLQVVLDAKRRDQTKLGYSGKKLSRNKLHRLRCGDTRVFSRKIEHKELNTAIHLLVDTSGSMRNRPDSPLQRALEACYALGAALDTIQYVNLAISSFPDRHGAHRTNQIKDFDEILKMKRFNLEARGGTPTAEAMLHAAYTLALQPEPRKIIFVLTDGEPDVPVNRVEEWLNKRGIEVFGVGIQCPLVHRTFKKSIVVEDLDKLALTMFKTLQKEL